MNVQHEERGHICSSPSDIHQGTSVCLVSFPADTRHLDPDVFKSNDVFPEPQCQEHTKSALGTSPQTLMRPFTKAVVLPLVVKLLSQTVLKMNMLNSLTHLYLHILK